MDTDKLKEVQSVVAESNVDAATTKALRKRKMFVFGIVMAIMAGGSCHSELSCGGIKTVGCSCTDKSPKKEEPKKPERMEY